MTPLTFIFDIPRNDKSTERRCSNEKNITNKIILTATLLILGTSSAQLPNTPIGFSSEAKAYHIGQDETNINELIKYYTQKPLTFSNRWLYQYDDGNIYVEFKRYSWSAHIRLWGAESWGNINQLRDRYVDVFGLKDKDTRRLWWVYTDTFTGGVTPAASSSDKPYNIYVQYKDKLQTFIGAHKIYQGNKPVLTLKEIDFRVRESLIKIKYYIMKIAIKVIFILPVVVITLQLI